MVEGHRVWDTTAPKGKNGTKEIGGKGQGIAALGRHYSVEYGG